MSDQPKPQPGSIAWTDLTVPDADGVRDFYSGVVGWKADAVPMDGYSDYSMNDASGQCVAGICHARGKNEGIPAQWMVYIIVEDVEAAAAKCTELGGEVVVAPKGTGGHRYCIIRDPAGAVCALYENAS